MEFEDLQDAYHGAAATADIATKEAALARAEREAAEKRLAEAEARLAEMAPRPQPQSFGAPVAGGAAPPETVPLPSLQEIKKLYARDKGAALRLIDQLGSRIDEIPEVAAYNAIANRDPNLTQPPRFIHPIES